MPHALFLGSSLASVDRLDMLPIEPSSERPPKSFNLPSLGLVSRLRRRRQTDQAHNEEAVVELSDHPQSSLSTSFASSSSRTTELHNSETEVDTKPSNVSLDLRKSRFELAQSRYEADIRAFDRIAWVDVHLLHATVRFCFKKLPQADGNHGRLTRVSPCSALR